MGPSCLTTELAGQARFLNEVSLTDVPHPLDSVRALTFGEHALAAVG
jgi:hypothetical protein